MDERAGGADRLSDTFLHRGTVARDRVRFPRLVGPRAFRGLWLALAALGGALLALAGTVAGRVA